MDHLKFEAIKKLRKGKRLVFTNGVFDVLHADHVSCLMRARELGDLLVVGMNTDASVKRLKGLLRPVHPLDARQYVLEALRCVDAVIPFEEDTPCKLIAELKPEVHVKGGDYDADALAEAPLVKSYGGEIVILPHKHGYFTTTILKQLESE